MHVYSIAKPSPSRDPARAPSPAYVLKVAMVVLALALEAVAAPRVIAHRGGGADWAVAEGLGVDAVMTDSPRTLRLLRQPRPCPL